MVPTIREVELVRQIRVYRVCREDLFGRPMSWSGSWSDWRAVRRFVVPNMMLFPRMLGIVGQAPDKYLSLCVRLA
jgi:hypothetical protein